MTRQDFRTRRVSFAEMATVFEHGNGLKSRLVVAAEDDIVFAKLASKICAVI